MSALKETALIFLVIATCGNDEGVRSFAWAVVIACAVIAITVWLVGMVFGTEVG